MDCLRRIILRGAGASGALAMLLAAGSLRPIRVLASEWNRTAFDAKDTSGALRGIGGSALTENKEIVLKAPDIAENGAAVPVEIVSNIPNTSFLAVIVEKNPFPLSAAFDFGPGAVPEISLRLKVAQTSAIRAVAKTTDGKYYTTSKEVKVTIGGCAG